MTRLRLSLLAGISALWVGGCTPSAPAPRTAGSAAAVRPRTERAAPRTRGAPPVAPRGPLGVGLAALGRRPAPDFEAALRAFRRVPSSGPTGRAARLNEAFCLLHLHRLDEAASVYLKLKPASDREALAGLLEVRLWQGDLRRALTWAERWLRDHPRDRKILSVAAHLQRRQRAYDAALAYVQRALALDRRDPRAYEEFGRIYLDRGSPRTALMIFDRGLVGHPKDAGLLFARGQALVALGEPGKGIMEYERAVRADPRLVAVRLHLGKIYVDNLDYRGALRHFQAVLAWWPNHREALLGVGRSLFGRKQFPKALAAYQRVLALAGEEPRALYQIGKIYQDHLDRPKEALAYFERYVRAQPNLSKRDPVWATLRMLRALTRPRPRPPRRRTPAPRRRQGGKSQ